MTEQEKLNITEVNKWSLDFVDDYMKLKTMNYADGTLGLSIRGHENELGFNLSKDQKEFLINWLQSE